MTTVVAKWGNNLVVRLPRGVAAEAAVSDGDAVDITVEAGAIVVRRAVCRYSLDELVRRITPQNRHGETGWGGAGCHDSW